VGGFKVGLDLFSAQGLKVLDRIRDLAPEAKLMMDLKMFDVPGTVAGAVEAIHIPPWIWRKERI
jgi:orotidine-5'-phosphate decarboxylase